MKARWHARAPRGLMRAWLASDTRPLELRPVNLGERFTIIPDEDGLFDAAQLAIAADAFRYKDGETHAVHPRLLEILYRAVDYFEVPYVTLVSGFRTTRATSRHNQGRAMDVVLPGVTDTRLSAFLRQQGYVGVGVYPQSGFVHLDVRERSYFFVDRSPPGGRTRPRQVAATLSRRYDREARGRGETSVPDLHAGDDDESEMLAEAPEEAAPAEPVATVAAAPVGATATSRTTRATAGAARQR